MKKIVLIISLLVSVCTMRAQDTINPFLMDSLTPTILRDSAHLFNIILGSQGDSTYIIRKIRTYGHDFPEQRLVTGLNIATKFGNKAAKDSVEVRGVLIKINDKDFQHPVCYFTQPVTAASHRPIDHYMAFDHDTSNITAINCLRMDTVVPVYSFYFDNPIPVSDTVYLGMYITDGIPRGGIRYGDVYRNYLCNCSGVPTNTIPGAEWNVDDTGALHLHIIGYGDLLECIFPIYSMPDTDSFGCPEVEGFGFAGMMAGSPTFTWTPAAEHRLYQLAYGPYDAPLDSLQVVETDNYFLELSDPSLSRDIYYQARLRAKCHHACPVHDTVMWTAWTDPVYFYTGDNMPDTTHHHGEPEGIAEVNGPVHFALAPNPAHGSVTLTLEGMPVAGTVLTIYDGAGREVLHRTLHERVTRIATKGLAAGLYTVTVSNPQGMGTHRLSVE